MGKTRTHTARIRLHVDSPLGGIEVEGLESPLLAKNLQLVNPLVASVVTGVWKSLRVLVGQDRAVRLHSRATGQVLS